MIDQSEIQTASADLTAPTKTSSALDSAKSTMEVLGFSLLGDEYVVPTNEVHEIMECPIISSLSAKGTTFLGTVLFQEMHVPVVDLRRLMSLGTTEPTQVKSVLLIPIHNGLVGIALESSTSIFRIDESQIEIKPRTIDRGSNEYLKGIAQDTNRLLIILDLNSIRATVKQIS